MAVDEYILCKLMASSSPTILPLPTIMKFLTIGGFIFYSLKETLLVSFANFSAAIR
jgi:hypothetical protein